MQRLYLLVLFLIDLSPQIDNRLRFCTNSGNIPSRFIYPKLNDEGTKSLYSPSIPALFPRVQSSVSKQLSKRIYPICQQVHRQLAARKLVRSEKKSRPKVQRRNPPIVFKKNSLGATKKFPFVAKGIIARENSLPLHQYSFVLRWNSLF